MARDVESLVLSMSADLRKFSKDMSAMRATADRRLNEVERRAIQADRRLSQTMQRAGQNMVASLKSGLAQLAPTLAGAFSTAAVLQYADAYTALQNRLKAAGLEGAALKRVEDSLYASANRNGVAVEATAELYQRAAMARNNLGASEEQLLALVSGTSAALKLQGTSAGEASGALLQLGQILGGQKVQAEEYNSLIDQLPVLLQAAADGSGRFGGQISTLTALVKGGKVTTQEFFAALLKGLGDVETRAANATPTVGAAFQTLNNELGRFVGQTDSGLSATQRLAQGIVLLSENLDTVVLVVGALATIVGTRYVLALTAATGAQIANGVSALRLAGFQAAMTASMTGTTTATVLATRATNAFTAAIAANPIGAALVAVTALAAGLYFLSRQYSDTAVASRELDRVTSAADSAIADYAAAVLAAKNASGEERKELLAKAAALREVTAARIADARVAAQRQIDEAVAARETADQRIAQLANRRAGVNDRSFSNASTSQDLGLARQTQASIDAAVRARQQADEALQALRRLEAAAQAAENPVSPPTPAPLAAEGAKGSSGPTPQELARQRQLLDLQADVERLRAQGRTQEADARQDEIDLLNLTKQYEDAGFENAQAKARVQVTALAAAREEARAAEEAARQREGAARALDLTRQFALDMLDVQEQLALTDQDALEVRRQILAIRQAERRAALEAAAADERATAAERQAAQAALAQLPQLEGGENRALSASSAGARDAQSIIADIRAPANAVDQAAEAYAEIDRLRQEDLISEQEAALAKSQIDARLMESRLGFASEFFGNLATLQSSSNKKLAALGKAAAIAQATIDGYLAVQKTLAAYPAPFNFVMAASVAAATAANVAAIAGMADGGLVTGVGGPREDNQLRRLSVGEFVNNAASVRRNRPFLEAANRGADLSKMLGGMADGGLIRRASAASAAVPLLAATGPAASMTFAPTIHAPGADMAAVRRIEQALDEQARNFQRNWKAAAARSKRFGMGGSR